MAAPARRTEGTGFHGESIALPPARRRKRAADPLPEDDEKTPSRTSLPPDIVNPDALALSQQQEEDFDPSILYCAMEEEYWTDPDIEPENLAQNLCQPDLIASLNLWSYNRVKKRFQEFMDENNVDVEAQAYYRRAVSELCKQAVLNGPFFEAAKDFHANAQQYLFSASYAEFQKAIDEVCDALHQTRQIGENLASIQQAIEKINQATAKLDRLKKLLSMVEQRPMQLVDHIIQDTFPSSKESYRTFCNELQWRRQEFGIDEIGELLRQRAESLLKMYQEAAPSAAPKIPKYKVFFDLDAEVLAEAIWTAGYLVLSSAISQSLENPSLRDIFQHCSVDSADQITEQSASLIWDQFATEPALREVDQRDFIHRCLDSLPDVQLEQIQKEFSTIHSNENAVDAKRRAEILFNAFSNKFRSPLTLPTLKRWCLSN